MGNKSTTILSENQSEEAASNSSSPITTGEDSGACLDDCVDWSVAIRPSNTAELLWFLESNEYVGQIYNSQARRLCNGYRPEFVDYRPNGDLIGTRWYKAGKLRYHGVVLWNKVEDHLKGGIFPIEFCRLVEGPSDNSTSPRVGSPSCDKTSPCYRDCVNTTHWDPWCCAQRPSTSKDLVKYLQSGQYEGRVYNCRVDAQYNGHRPEFVEVRDKTDGKIGTRWFKPDGKNFGSMVWYYKVTDHLPGGSYPLEFIPLQSYSEELASVGSVEEKSASDITSCSSSEHDYVIVNM
mmetsp:Transcript_5932/g.9811  ORF Transcript_5932/g.9811 Transcript_5932/m.9811 type:complete len:292 (-) Transcript_5932:52-927(-)|eukprot:CAMPEP_0174971628 /NCGR_PEP_ID=MMETSP0004_2-20121128/10124_1 /TAXON_ID=420556 /ORGANISM="Ochromonas sp., Strain CCMP1393" /LENGTH=291 /DNA_ID=CAMNT_0016221651 /DNA_START=45 /DNA_END=920 /DNA_ORIENTATION=-